MATNGFFGEVCDRKRREGKGREGKGREEMGKREQKEAEQWMMRIRAEESKKEKSGPTNTYTKIRSMISRLGRDNLTRTNEAHREVTEQGNTSACWSIGADRCYSVDLGSDVCRGAEPYHPKISDVVQ
eukprot:767627-Hanusia_phi.AAC.2